jgi:Ca2+-binding RTX toxin-like protein
MKWSIPRPRARARLVASLVMASAVSLLTVAGASAQTVKPAETTDPGLPTTLSVIPGVSTAPGQPPATGLTLEQTQAAYKLLSAQGGAAVSGPISAVFLPGVGALSIFGSAQDDTIVVSRNAAGNLLVNGGAVPIVGGTPTVANTALIQEFGLGGDDTLSLDEANGALPQSLLFGGSGNDVLTGGSGADQLFGQDGNDTLLGKGGNDLLFGGAGKDQLTGGDADDQVFGEAGDDTMIWNPGDDTDLNEGGDGNDTVQVNGGNGDEIFSATANGARVRFDRVSPAPFSIDIGTSENLSVNMNGGDDQFTGSNGLAPLIKVTVDGGSGNDKITGGDGDDTLLGEDGNDLIVPGRGTDTASGGAGDDTFVWNPGDGNDLIEGQDGADTMQFNGANVAEKIDLSANRSRLRLTRDVANIVMDINGVEQVNVVEQGGADTTTVNDLSGTGVTGVALDLSTPPGSGTADGATDTIVVSGTRNDDNVQIAGQAGSVSVAGLPASVSISGAEATDRLTVQGLGGSDTLTASGLAANVIGLTLDGGNGKDTLTGSAGDDILIGGDGADTLVGFRGNDTMLGGAGDDTLVWNPGDGSDVLEGQDGTDTMQFNGANVTENFDVSANGGRVRFTRDVANIVMDLDDVERINVTELGGADTTTVNDLTGTDVTNVSLDLSGTPGSGTGDGASDTVNVNGTAVDDTIRVNSSAHGVTVTGLPAKVTLTGAESIDRLVVRGLAGVDTIQANGVDAGAINLTLDGGEGDDTLVGGASDDVLIGGRGNDSMRGGPGDDVFIWNPGDGSDILEGQAGTDTMQFNGANVAEKFELSANGPRLRFTRDVANIIMDADGIEHVNVVELGGADLTTVNNLSGTDVTAVALDLSGTPGSGQGDGAADEVIVNATAGADVVNVSAVGGSAALNGLAAQVSITGAENANDRLTVNALAGDDVVEGSAVGAGAIQLRADGGDGDDVLIGGAGNDVLLGGNGDDVLNGGPGQDVLDGGPGNNVVLQ